MLVLANTQLTHVSPQRLMLETITIHDFPKSMTEFQNSYGDGQPVKRPLVFKGAALKWALNSYASEANLQSQFGDILVNVTTGWGTDKSATIPMLFSEHLEDILYNPELCGYLLEHVLVGTNVTRPSPGKGEVRNKISTDDEGSFIVSSLEKLAPFPLSEDFPLAVLFFGGKSITALHRHSHNFLVQIKGKKKVLLIDPKYGSKLGCPMPSEDEDKCTSTVNPENPDFLEFPNFHTVEIFEGLLSEGDILYIPTDWFHYIKGEETPSLSLAFFPNH